MADVVLASYDRSVKEIVKRHGGTLDGTERQQAENLLSDPDILAEFIGIFTVEIQAIGELLKRSNERNDEPS